MNVKIKFGLISLVIIVSQSIIKIYGVILTGSLSFLSETLDTVVDIMQGWNLVAYPFGGPDNLRDVLEIFDTSAGENDWRVRDVDRAALLAALGLDSVLCRLY